MLSCRSEKLARQSVVTSYFAECCHVLLCRVLSFRSEKPRRSVLSSRSEKLARQSVVTSCFADRSHVMICRVVSFWSEKLSRYSVVMPI